MRATIAVTLATVALFGASGPAAAYSGEYVARTMNCAESVEKWIKHYAGGDKILEERGRMGAFAAYLVRWNDGSVQEVTIGPANDEDGRPAICVLAKRHVNTAAAM